MDSGNSSRPRLQVFSQRPSDVGTKDELHRVQNAERLLATWGCGAKFLTENGNYLRTSDGEFTLTLTLPRFTEQVVSELESHFGFWAYNPDEIDTTPVRDTQSITNQGGFGPVNPHLITKLAIAGADELIDHTENVLKGGERAGYENVLKLINTRLGAPVRALFVALIGEGNAAGKTPYDVEKDMPVALIAAYTVLLHHKGPVSETLVSLVRDKKMAPPPLKPADVSALNYVY